MLTSMPVLKRGSIMLKNGLYSLIALAIDGADIEVGGVLILRDGKVYGGDSFVFYTGTYDDLDGRWRGELTSKEHTPTNRPPEERIQYIEFSGTYDATNVEADATVHVGKQRIHYTATLRLLTAN